MFNEENFQSRTNLAENASLTTYAKWAAQQTPNAYKVFYEFMEVVKPKRILEIGTGLGGFTMFTRMCSDDLNLNTEIRSYDVSAHSGDQDLRDMNIDVRIENVFNSNYTEVDKSVIDFVQQDGSTVVLCDGGNKIHEFNLLSDYIKPGDFIMAHDYASDPEYFKEHVYMKLWNWHEIADSDIKEATDRNKLSPYMKDKFDSAVWVCKIKIN